MEAHNCCSEWRETGTQIEKTENHMEYQSKKSTNIFDENWNPNSKKKKENPQTAMNTKIEKPFTLSFCGQDLTSYQHVCEMMAMLESKLSLYLK